MPMVEFTSQFLLHRGAAYNTGERAMLTDAEAQSAMAQDCAVLVTVTKTVVAPPMDKQIKASPVAK